MILSLSGETSIAQFLGNIMAGIKSESGDTYNRHRYLHVQEYRQANVPCVDASDIALVPVPNRYDLEWVKTKTAEWMKLLGKSIKAYLLSYEDYDRDLDEILAEHETVEMVGLMNLHLEAVNSKISGYIKYPNRRVAKEILLDHIGLTEMSTPNKVLLSSCRFKHRWV